MPSMFFLLRSIISGLSSATASSRESSSIKESWPSREPELGGSVKTLSREALSKSVSFLNPAAPTSSEDWVSYLHGLPHVPQGTPGPGQLAQGVQAVQHLDNRSQQTTRGQKQRQMDYQETASTFPPCIIASHLLVLHVGYVLGGQGGGSGAGGLDTVTAWGGRQLQYWTLVV